MIDEGHAQDTAQTATAPPTPAELVRAALDKMNHPSALDLHSRLDGIQNAVNVIGGLVLSA